MKDLFIDTASNKRIVSILNNHKIVKENIEDNGIDLSSRMVPMLQTTMQDAKMLPSEIDNIYVVIGPGSFTGIRIGVTIAKTYAWSMKKKIIPLSELETYISSDNITKGNHKSDYLIPYINARRNYVYAGIYTPDLKNYMPDQHIALQDLLNNVPSDSSVIFVSFDNEPINNESVKELKKRNIIYSFEYPQFDIERVTLKHQDDEGINPHECNPVYLKDTEAEEKLRRKEN